MTRVPPTTTATDEEAPTATDLSLPGHDAIRVRGARVHNLRNIDVTIPRGSLTVVTGLSGSGKSSLAFDTIYAEGQRRYIETFSAYARGFLGNRERPDVDMISGLSPVISIDQKTTNKNPRSTVGTVTETYDYLRLLFARAGEAYSYVTGERMVRYTEEQIVELIMQSFEGRKVYLLAPLVKGRKGHYRELFEQVQKKGFLRARVDGEVVELAPGMKVDRYKNHTIEVVVDRLVVRETDRERLRASVATTLRQGEGLMLLLDVETGQVRYLSKRLMCPTSGISYRDPAPHNFSFNSPQGACPRCKGLGSVHVVSRSLIIPDTSLSIRKGALAPLGKWRDIAIFWQLEVILGKHGLTLDTPLSEFPPEAIDEIIEGSPGLLRIPSQLTKGGEGGDRLYRYEGLAKYILMTQENEDSLTARRWAEQFSLLEPCPECKGQRLNQEALHFRLDGHNIAELAAMDISGLRQWVDTVPERLPERQRQIATEILKEIGSRLGFLTDVGLGYLSLSRPSYSLSGGESQRIRLATQIGSQLVNVLYILDEPSIGLHQRDNLRLINSLKSLRDMGNTVIVVEHDAEMMRAADYVVDIGPLAGRRGGEVVFEGTYAEMLTKDTLTSLYLSGRRAIETPEKRREGSGLCLTLHGCRGNNLRNIDAAFPLGKLICVTGVSGSGKSSLVGDTLYPILASHFYRSLRQPLPYDSVEGLEHIDKAICVDQAPIGRTPRSNPATFCGVSDEIRVLFAQLPEAKIRGYRPGRFSFNAKGGRCETCRGNGYRIIEMNFLPDVLVPCPECQGRRYNRETLEVRFKGKSIADVLDMTVDEAVDFFGSQPAILHKIKALQDVGLGYIKLGQPSTTLSGGESQRVKLAAELAKRDTGKTLYILDEPTTGLHFEDIRLLLSVLGRLVDKGNTVIIIEHNLDIIRSADWLIEMGPEGGRDGGDILFEGTPEGLRDSSVGYTRLYL